MTVTASNFERKENDLYETEPWAVEALMRRFHVKGQRVWEPSAGNHAISDVLLNLGAEVLTSDIRVYERAHSFSYDFLSTTKRGFSRPIDWIITNPPYGRGNRDAVKYARNALSYGCNVALLLTAKFDFGKTRKDLFADCPHFAGKISLLDRISWAGNGETGTEDHAWYIWTSHHHSQPTIFYEGKI